MIKQAIIKNGSVSASYEATSDSYNKQYFYTGSDKSNHSITIVGYDDRISRELFGEKKPESDGAWILKNSWGTGSGNGGYFYLSYEQPLNSAVAYDYMAADT